MDNCEELVSVDLHIHTPASKCYKWTLDREEDEYIRLLEDYREKDIKVIAITDHNTISGYNKLMDMKQESIQKIAVWKELEYLEGVKEAIDKEEEKLKLFNYFLILPGVEFEAVPGIHLLLIFNPKIDVNIISKFLIDRGYNKEIQGSENGQVSSVSAIEVVKDAYELGAITIAAHIESSKGALNEFNPGACKAQFFKANELLGVQIVNTYTITVLKELYKNKDYKRNKPPAFIKCSDYHGKDDSFEKSVTYMKLQTLDFDGVKEAILNSIECLSFTKNLKDNEIIEALLAEDYTYTFLKISEMYLTEIKKTICSILNTGQGTIVIGAEENNILGVKKNKEEINLMIKELMECFEESKNFLRYKVDYYEMGNHTIVVLKLNSIAKHIYTLDGRVYIEENKKVLEATPKQLVKLGELKFKANFQFINIINKKRIEKINEELSNIKQLEENINIYKSLVDISLKFRDVFNIQIIEPNLQDDDSSESLDFFIGDNNGGTYYANTISPIHTEECYLRLTCPQTNKNIKIIKEKKFSGECLVIVIGGVTHYINGESEYKFVTKMPLMRITLKDEFREKYSLKAIGLWFKSPILLYLVNIIYGTTDIFNLRVALDIPIVISNLFEFGSKLDKRANTIIEYEKDIIEYVNYNYKFDNIENIDLNSLNEVLSEHNMKVNKIGKEIEKILKKHFDFNDEEYNIIKKFIKNKKWGFFLEEL